MHNMMNKMKQEMMKPISFGEDFANGPG